MEIRLENPRPIVSLALQESTGLLAIGQHGDESGNPNLTLWSIDTGRLQKIVETTHEEYVSAVTLSRTGTLFYYTRDLGLVGRRLDDGERIGIGSDLRDVRRVEVHPDDASILICGERLDLWDLTTDRRMWSLPYYRSGEVIADDFFADTCWDGLEQTTAGYESYPALGTFSKDGSRIFVAGDNRDRLAEVDTVSKEVRRSFQCSPLQVTSIAHSEHWSVVGVIGRIPPGAFVWDTNGGGPILDGVFNRSYTNTSTIAFSRSKRVVLVGTTVGYVNIHTLDAGRLLTSCRVHRGAIRCMVVDDNGEVIATGGDDGRVVISKLNTLL